MSEQIECPNCGAVLRPEDEFCGECGARRPGEMEVPGPQASPQPGGRPIAGQADAVPPVRLGSEHRFEGESAWRFGFYVLVVLGILACLGGLILFLVLGLSDSNVATPGENWLYSALCCLAPVGGTGALLLLAGIAIWYARLREPGTNR